MQPYIRHTQTHKEGRRSLIGYHRRKDTFISQQKNITEWSSPAPIIIAGLDHNKKKQQQDSRYYYYYTILCIA